MTVKKALEMVSGTEDNASIKASRNQNGKT